MRNYHIQQHSISCAYCNHVFFEEHYGFYCTHNVENPVKIDWGNLYTSVHEFHEWADSRMVDSDGVCDYWCSGGIIKGDKQ